jgi:hypothetical protein
VAWALRSLWRQLDPPPGDKAAILQILDDLTRDLRLELAWGKENQILDPARQDEAFAAANGYDPQRFQQQIARLLAAIGKGGR